MRFIPCENSEADYADVNPLIGMKAAVKRYVCGGMYVDGCVSVCVCVCERECVCVCMYECVRMYVRLCMCWCAAVLIFTPSSPSPSL